MTRSLACAAAAIGMAAVTVLAQNPSSLQLGLRLSSEHSIQWSGGTIYLEGRSFDTFQTGAKTIFDIWPGSVPGSFSVYSDQGVGLLLGDKLVPGGDMFGERALLRSANTETVCGAIISKKSDRTSQTRFIEWRTVNLQRELAAVAAAVIDFDVDRSSRVLYLTADSRVYLLAGTEGLGAQLMLPKAFLRRPERVFLDANSEEIVVFGGSQVARLALATREWSVTPFDIRRQALVRHVFSRRVRPEDRFR